MGHRQVISTAALGSLVLLALAAKPWQDTTVEAETMAPPTSRGAVYHSRSASGREALELYANGTASKRFSTIAAADELEVTARGDQCGGPPIMAVDIDGTKVLSQSVAASRWTSYTAAVSVPAGSHTLRVGYENDHSSSSCDRNLRVDAVILTSAPSWTSSFERGGFSEWTWWRRIDGGTVNTADPGSEGVPAHGGSKVAHFQVTADQLAAGRIHSKLYKNWALGSPETGWHDNAGRALERLPGDDPSGVYTAWFYLRPGYCNPSSRWTNVFQFKEGYLDASGAHHQDPQWWVNMSRADAWPAPPPGSSGCDPVLHINHWRQDYGSYHPALVAAPRGRWFQLKAVLRQGDRVDWYLDGRRFETSRDRTYPVGVLGRSVGWVFGIGHYDGVGELWADDASFAPG